MAEKSTVHETTLDDGSTGKPTLTKGQRVKAHFKKWWWAYLIGLIVIVLVVVLPVVYVGYPNIAQDGINDSRLVLSQASFLNPRPDSFDLDLQTILLSDSQFHPDLRSWNASLHVNETAPAFAYITVPALAANNNTLINISQPVDIVNQEQFAEFCILALSSNAYTISLQGEGDLQLGALPTISVDYDQEVESQGLNHLEGLTIETFFLQLNESLPNGANSNGTIYVPNTSPMTLAIGDANFQISVDGTDIAIASVSDLVLVPGDNTFDVNVVSNLTAVVDLLHLPAYGCGQLPVDIVGINSTRDGVVLPYFTAALQHNSVRTMLDLVPALERQGLDAVLTGNCTT